MYTGTIVALPTPFRAGRVDLDSFRLHVRHLLAAGVRGLAPCGTTGEAPVLDPEEHRSLIEAAVTLATGRVPVIAGTGANDTRKAIALTRTAREAGADAALVVTPYYNRPSQDGLYRHYLSICEAVDLPVVLYSVPTRTGVALAPETVARLARNARVIALKEAGGCVDRLNRIREYTDLPILSGDDALTLPMLAVGAVGSISVTGNVAPALVEEMTTRFAAGDVESARAVHHRLVPLTRLLFSEPSPAPVKAALARMGLMRDEVRPPLTSASTACRALLEEQLETLDLLPDREEVPSGAAAAAAS